MYIYTHMIRVILTQIIWQNLAQDFVQQKQTEATWLWLKL